VKYYSLPAQVLAKMVFYNLLPKSGEYSHAQGSSPLVIYYLLQSIKVNIPKLIINFMLSKHLLILNRNLPYRMIITHLLKHLKIDLSPEKVISPSVDNNSTLLKRMQAGTHDHAPPLLPIQPQVHFIFGSSLSSVDP